METKRPTNTDNLRVIAARAEEQLHLAVAAERYAHWHTDHLLSRITQLEAALRSIVTGSGVTEFDDEEPTFAIHRIAYIGKAAL